MATKKVKLQDKIKNLEDIGKFFNNSNDELDLEVAVEKYGEAAKLVKEIKAELKSIEVKIQEINKINDEEIDESSEKDPIFDESIF